MINKNKNYEVKIVDLLEDGKGVGKVDGFTLFVNGARLGDQVLVKINKLKKYYGFADLIKVMKKADDHVEAPCKYFDKCGGCTLQYLPYDKQLKIKKDNVINTLKRIGKFDDIKVEEVEGSNNTYNYRNKAVYAVKNSKIGMYKAGSRSLTEIDYCMIQKESNKDIIKRISKFIKDTSNKAINHLMIRTSSNKDIQVVIAIDKKELKNKDKLIDMLKDIENIKSIVVNYNKNKRKILGTNYDVIYGDKYIKDTLKDLTFKISPTSFYQVNKEQTEKLYEKVLEFADLSKEDYVIDAYCGIGTISLFLAKYVKKVKGIEVVKEAIIDAKENAKINKIENIEFEVGKVEDVIKKDTKADTLVVDPPRAGCDDKLIQTIKEIKPKKLIYVSCNPATLARDLKKLKEVYNIEKIKPFDMFPQTMHVETVVKLFKI